MNTKRVMGISTIIVGIILFTFFNEAKLFWFTGGPFGFVLVLFGLLETAESFSKKAKTTSNTTSMKQKVIDFFK